MLEETTKLTGEEKLIMRIFGLGFNCYQEVNGISLGKALEGSISYLTPREARIIQLRFGLDSDNPQTLEQVARPFYVTRERIRQIEAKALRKLRHPNHSRILKRYIKEG